MWSMSGRGRSRIETMSLPVKLGNVEHGCEERVYNFLLQDERVMPGRSQTLVAGTSDLFLQSRITELAVSLGVAAYFAADSAGLKRQVTPDTVLVVLDLSDPDYDPFEAARDMKGAWPSLQILGFFPHVKAELRTQGERAGVDVIVPNSKFLETLKKVLGQEVRPPE